MTMEQATRSVQRPRFGQTQRVSRSAKRRTLAVTVPPLTPPTQLPTNVDGGVPPVDFSTAVGRMPQLARVIRDWDRLIEGVPLRLLSRLQLLEFPEMDGIELDNA